MQVQLVEFVLLAGEWEFVGQPVHWAAPVNGLYFPASHAVHRVLVAMLQEATKPEEATLPSDVNTTCMYPVLDV